MTFSLNRDEEIVRIVEAYSNTVFKICLIILCNVADAEDAVQNTFLKYITKAPTFQSREHEKAWFIKVSTNICIDMCRFRKRHTMLNIDDFHEYYHSEESRDILKAIMELSEKYKIIVYLYCIYGYKTDEIASILRISPSTVRKRLQYGRQLLRIEYGEERNHEERTIY